MTTPTIADQFHKDVLRRSWQEVNGLPQLLSLRPRRRDTTWLTTLHTPDGVMNWSRTLRDRFYSCVAVSTCWYSDKLQQDYLAKEWRSPTARPLAHKRDEVIRCYSRHTTVAVDVQLSVFGHASIS